MNKSNSYYSPILTRLHQSDRPGEDTACASCPVSLWYMTNDETNDETLTCFCSALHRAVWNKNQKAVITRCDAREQALAE